MSTDEWVKAVSKETVGSRRTEEEIIKELRDEVWREKYAIVLEATTAEKYLKYRG